MAGYYYRMPNGYAEHHKIGECPPPAAPKPPVTEGFYWLDDGNGKHCVHIKMNKKTGRLNAEVLAPSGRFVYGVGMLKKMQTGDPVRIDGEELQKLALQYAIDHDNCIFCGLELTDPRSNPKKGGVGYGPVCAKNYNLPW